MTVKALKQLWQEAFGDPKDFIDLFFSAGYAPQRCHYIAENGVPVSALYWFDCALNGRKFAYLYGVATLKSHRGKSLAKQLLQETHELLRAQGYAGTLLVPHGVSLFDFYRRSGYETATTATEFSLEAGNAPAAMAEVSPVEYARLRKNFLPAGGLELGEDHLRFLASYCKFFAGRDFALICEKTPDGLWVQELLGNTRAAPEILRALDCPKGRFRAPGDGRKFAMWLPLQKNCPKPSWFGSAMD